MGGGKKPLQEGGFRVRVEKALDFIRVNLDRQPEHG
jgi:hypothetical protein